MKILFVYFNKKQICETPEQAIRFINGLHYRNLENQPNLVVNANTEQLLKNAFESKWEIAESGVDMIRINGYNNYSYMKIATTNCKDSRIFGYCPKADTVEEHDRILQERDAAIEEQRQAKERKTREAIMSEMLIERKGWYKVSITFNCFKWDIYKCEHKWVESTFSGCCIAESKMDAFRKACKDIETGTNTFDGQGFRFPEPTDPGSVYVCFLGVKTDDGYSVAIWNEWKEKGAI